MVKAKFTAYSRMYDKRGKLIAKKYVSARGDSREKLERDAKKINAIWNKQNRGGQYVTFAGIKGHVKRKHHVERIEHNGISGFGLFNARPSKRTRDNSHFGLNFRI